MAHWDFLADNAPLAKMQPGPTGLHPYLDNLVRLSKLPVATISEIRGRTRGAGSEFVLATDIRFASEKAILGQFEIGVGAVPGGGPMARLGRLVGRGRALEILLGGDDIPAGRERTWMKWMSTPSIWVMKCGSAAKRCSNRRQS